MGCKISIITPSYNQGRYLEETIQSVLSQGDAVHEYFVMDGGSTDESGSILRRYADRISGWVSEKDQGQTDAIVKGFRRATGDVLGWLNSDDVYLPGAMRAVQQCFAADPALELLTGYLVLLDSGGRITRSCRVPAPDALMQRFGPMLICQQGTFFRRELYERVGGLNIDYHCAMDMDLWSRFYHARPVWRTLPRHIAGFRRHDETKGVAPQWAARYLMEKQWVQERHANLHRPGARQLGVLWYRLVQLTSGRHLRALCETRRWRGRSVADVFAADNSGMAG